MPESDGNPNMIRLWKLGNEIGTAGMPSTSSGMSPQRSHMSKALRSQPKPDQRLKCQKVQTGDLFSNRPINAAVAAVAVA